MDKPIGDGGKFRHIGANEGAGRVLIDALLYGIINAHRIDARSSRLHLYLRPMDSRFIIDKLPRQMQPAITPRQPQMIACEGHQHGPHPEIDPSMLIERAHTGVNEGESRLPCPPGRKPLRVSDIGANPIIGAMEVFKFKPGLIFKLLHEVAMPMLAPDERDHRRAPAL